MRRVIGLMAMLAFLGAATVVASGSAAANSSTPTAETGSEIIASPDGASGCPNGHVCVYPGTQYGGSTPEVLCTGGSHPLFGWYYSAKNSCANKEVILKGEGGEIMACMNPNGERPFPGPFKEVYVFGEGSRC